MQLFSIGRLYIGMDEYKHFDILIHLWKFRVEWEQSPKHFESLQGPANGSILGVTIHSDGEDSTNVP